MSKELTVLNETQSEALRQAIEDLENSPEKNVLKFLPEYLLELVKKIPDELMLLSDEEIRERIWGDYDSIPSPVFDKLRYAFWMEYDRCMRLSAEKMNMNNVIANVTKMSWFMRTFIKEPINLVWLLSPPVDYTKELQDILNLGLWQLRRIMELDHINDKGQVNSKIAELKLKIFQHVDMRIKGSFIQNVNQTVNQTVNSKSLNVNVNVDATPQSPGEKPLSFEEIQERIALLERETEMLSSPSVVNPDIMSVVVAKPDPDTIRVRRDIDSFSQAPGDDRKSHIDRQE